VTRQIVGELLFHLCLSQNAFGQLLGFRRQRINRAGIMWRKRFLLVFDLAELLGVVGHVRARCLEIFFEFFAAHRFRSSRRITYPPSLPVNVPDLILLVGKIASADEDTRKFGPELRLQVAGRECVGDRFKDASEKRLV
jgi:hypothetical protein